MKGRTDDSDNELDGRLAEAIEAILAEPSPTDARQRLIDEAASWTPASVGVRPRWRIRSLVALAVAASVLLAVGVGLYLAGAYFGADRGATGEVAVNPEGRADQGNESMREDGFGAGASKAGGSIGSRGGMRGLTRASNVFGVVAESAPVMLANGRGKTIHLGAQVVGTLKDAEASVHIWDWSRSPYSRVLKGMKSLGRRDVLSPDGKLLLTTGGDILDLKTGRRRTIDLGQADFKPVKGRRVREGISGVRFSTDGGRIAVLERRWDKEMLRGYVRIVDFATGRKLCRFPVGQPFGLRIAFSADGKQVAASDPSKHILRRDATTGRIIKRYEPATEGGIGRLAISPDGCLVAATHTRRDGNKDDLLVWEAETGRLALKVDGSGGNVDIDRMRFSPDSKLLATAGNLDVTVYSAATGKIVRRIRQRRLSAQHVQWSADGKTITVVTEAQTVGGGRGRDPAARYDVYPAVYEFDWKSGKLIRALKAPAPPPIDPWTRK